MGNAITRATINCHSIVNTSFQIIVKPYSEFLHKDYHASELTDFRLDTCFQPSKIPDMPLFWVKKLEFSKKITPSARKGF
jgi:hypothetical protein